MILNLEVLQDHIIKSIEVQEVEVDKIRDVILDLEVDKTKDDILDLEVDKINIISLSLEVTVDLDYPNNHQRLMKYQKNKRK
jgi:hypothetical protein